VLAVVVVRVVSKSKSGVMGMLEERSCMLVLAICEIEIHFSQMILDNLVSVITLLPIICRRITYNTRHQ
jgi:hypothetical protein